MRLHPLAWALLLAPCLTHTAQETTLGEVTVTGTREGESLAETPAAIGIVKGEAIRQDKPAHPAPPRSWAGCPVCGSTSPAARGT